MNDISGKKNIIRDLLYNRNFAFFLWFGLALLGSILEVLRGAPNNYLIFKGVFYHTIHQQNLFLEYPAEYMDVNHYGPTFSLIIAPFTLFPDKVAAVLWVLFNAVVLFVAINKLPFQKKWRTMIILLASLEMMVAAEWLQSNPFVCACILFGFIFINKGKDAWALFFIMLATFIKLYGIVGFAFFFFSKDRLHFIKWAIIWSAVFFAAPFIISPPSFVIQSYADWLHELQFKAVKNTRVLHHNDFQDISVMGMVRRIFHIRNLKNYWITLPAVVLFLTQYLPFKDYKDIRYRLYLLCSVLITTVIFTTSAESPTYIIAFPGICIWYVMQPSRKWVNIVFVFSLLLTSLSYSDIFTPYVRENIIRPYSLKALPCFIIWLVIIVQTWKKQYLSTDLARINDPSGLIAV
ncbi:MAG: glycosyltransferase family 87 protein [Sediminibacterium sp.]